MRLLHGGELNTPITREDLLWDLKVLWYHRWIFGAAGIALILGAWAGAAWGFGKLCGTDPDNGRPAALGLRVFLAVGLLDALGGTFLHFMPPFRAGTAAILLLLTRSLAVTYAVPALVFRFGRGGVLRIVFPSLLLTAMGLGLWSTRMQVQDPTPPIKDHFAQQRISAINTLGELLPHADAPEAWRAYLKLMRAFRTTGSPGIQDLLNAPGPYFWLERKLLLDYGREAIPLLKAGLRSPYPMVRRRAVWTLAYYSDDPEIVRATIPLFEDPDDEVRDIAVRLLDPEGFDAKSRPLPARLKETLGPLKKLIFDRDPQRRYQALNALIHQGAEEAITELAAIVKCDGVGNSGSRAVNALCRLGSTPAIRVLADLPDEPSVDLSAFQKKPLAAAEIELLVQRLGTKRDAAVQAMLWHCLPEQGLRLSPPSTNRLLTLATSTDKNLRTVALRVLSHLDDPRAIEVCRKDLESGTEVWSLEGLRRNGRADAEQVMKAFNRSPFISYRPDSKDVDLAPLLEVWALDPSRSAQHRSSALHNLKLINPQRAGQVAMRIHAQGPPETPPSWLLTHLEAPELLEVVEHSDGKLLEAALLWFARLPAPPEPKRLPELIRSTTSRQVRTWALQLAAKTCSRAAIPALWEVFHSLGQGAPPEGKLGILWQIAQCGDPAVLPRLREFASLRPTNDQHGQHATGIADLFEGASKPEVLLDLLGRSRRWYWDAYWQVLGRDAAKALVGLGEPGLDTLLWAAEDPELRCLVLDALGRSASPQAQETITRFLSHADGKVRRAAALALGRRPDPKTLELLKELSSDPVLDVREAAAWAIQEITGVDSGLRLVDEIPPRLERVPGPP